MKLIAYDKNKIKNIGGYKKTENMKIIDEFVDSGLDCVKVEGWTQKYAWRCAWSLNQTIKRLKKSGIRALSRDGEVFLIKETKTK
jgi:hypothetical protein